MDHENPLHAPGQESPAGALLKRLLQRLSQTEISRRTGIPQPTLSRWANDGVPDASDDTLKLVRLESELKAANDDSAGQIVTADYAGPDRRKAGR